MVVTRVGPVTGARGLCRHRAVYTSPCRPSSSPREANGVRAVRGTYAQVQPQGSGARGVRTRGLLRVSPERAEICGARSPFARNQSCRQVLHVDRARKPRCRQAPGHQDDPQPHGGAEDPSPEGTRSVQAGCAGGKSATRQLSPVSSASSFKAATASARYVEAVADEARMTAFMEAEGPPPTRSPWLRLGSSWILGQWPLV